MRLHLFTGIAAALLVSGCAMVQPTQADEDHAAHHPPGSAPDAAAASSPASAATPATVDQQMRAMQAMHQKMQAAKTPAERAALMDEHMKLMQSGMAMMGRMRGAAAAGAGGMPGMGGTGMMDMHQQMERRMALMEQMMQMMVDREAATKRQ